LAERFSEDAILFFSGVHDECRFQSRVRITLVYGDPDKTGPGQPNTKPPVASWGGNRFVSSDFLQVQ
jgi:hypothetical protein